LCLRLINFPALCWRTIIQRFRYMAISRQSKTETTDQLTFWSEEPPANLSASQDLEADWVTTVVTWPSNSLNLLTNPAHTWNGHAVAQRLVSRPIRRVRVTAPRNVSITVREAL